MNELKACPFCGRRQELQERISPYYNRKEYRVACEAFDCPAKPGTSWFFDNEIAVKLWNRRYSDGQTE